MRDKFDLISQPRFTTGGGRIGFDPELAQILGLSMGHIHSSMKEKT